MTVERDPRLDSVLTAPPEGAWQSHLREALGNLFCAPDAAAC